MSTEARPPDPPACTWVIDTGARECGAPATFIERENPHARYCPDHAALIDSLITMDPIKEP